MIALLILFLMLVFLLGYPFLLVILTKKENEKGHWYPVSLKYLAYRKASLIHEHGMSLGAERYIRELSIGWHLLLIMSLYQQDILLSVACILIVVWTSYETEYFNLVHRVYIKARYTSLISLFLIALLFLLSVFDFLGCGWSGFYSSLILIIWHIRITAFRAIHWYRHVKVEKRSL